MKREKRNKIGETLLYISTYLHLLFKIRSQTIFSILLKIQKNKTGNVCMFYDNALLSLFPPSS